MACLKDKKNWIQILSQKLQENLLHIYNQKYYKIWCYIWRRKSYKQILIYEVSTETFQSLPCY